MEKQKQIVRFISHEIRTPLNTILIGIDELRDSHSGKVELFDDMKAASEVAVDTLNDLISHHSLLSESEAFDFADENASHLIESSIQSCQRHVRLLKHSSTSHPCRQSKEII